MSENSAITYDQEGYVETDPPLKPLDVSLVTSYVTGKTPRTNVLCEEPQLVLTQNVVSASAYFSSKKFCMYSLS